MKQRTRRLAAVLTTVLLAACGADNTAPPAPARLFFSAPPTAATAGVAMTPAVTVAVQDERGHTVTSATTAVTVTLANNAAGATLSGTTTVNAVEGIATFSDLSVDKSGTGYTLAASADGLTSATSASFTIDAPVPTKLVFTVSPGATVSGVAIAPAVQVAIQDPHGITVTSATDAVTLAFGSNPGGATLSGTTTVHAVSGVVTFSDLSVDKAATGYTLTATSGSLTSATSASFAISAVPTALRVITTTTGASFPSSYQLSVDCDYYYSYGCRYNSPIAVNDSVTMSVDPGIHSVTLSSPPDNCTLSGDAARTVTANGLTDVRFNVACAGLGTVQVTTTTGGTDPTPDGYLVCIDQSGTDCHWSAQLQPNDAVSIGRVLSGPHTVTLTAVGGNCVVSGGAAHAVTVPIDAAVSAPFGVSCVPTERIAFATSGTISMVHADGTAVHAITGGAAPAWSPDGARLAYQCNQQICVMNAGGIGSTAITAGGATNLHPTWSPDGSKIAFASIAGGTAELYVGAAIGGGAARLTQNVGVVGSPAWSPDGTQIAFDCEVDAGNIDICVIRADGTGFARLTSDPASDYGAAWKPDGSALAFATTRFGVDEIVLMSPAGGSVTRIGGGLPGVAPTWSPDGTQLAFVQLRYDPTAGPVETIVVSRADGSNLHLIARGAQPAWRPHQ